MNIPHSAKLASIMVMTLAVSTNAAADTYSGRLKPTADSASRIRISCFDDGNGPAARVYFDVRASTRTAPFLVTATIEKNGVTDSVTDKLNGDKKASPSKVFQQGDGDYYLTVSKAKKKASDPDKKLKGIMVFSGTAHCETAWGTHTGTNIPRR